MLLASMMKVDDRMFEAHIAAMSFYMIAQVWSRLKEIVGTCFSKHQELSAGCRKWSGEKHAIAKNEAEHKPSCTLIQSLAFGGSIS